MKKLAFLFLLILPLLVSCPIEDPFASLEGTNLLSDNEQAFTGWAVEYGKTVSYDYMTFNDSTEAGPDSDSTVKRLEIVNLVPNGDFENALSATAWVDVGGGSGTISADGHLNYNLPNTVDRVDFKLTDSSDGLSDGLPANSTYLIHFNLLSATATSIFEYQNDSPQPWTCSVSDTTKVYLFPDYFIDSFDSTFQPGGTNIFSIGTTSTGDVSSGYIDNLRINRTDITPNLGISVPVESDGRDNLLSGTYRFTVYVKNDPAVTPVTANRMAADFVSISILSPDEASVMYSNTGVFESSSAWDDWTACSVTAFIQIDDAATYAFRLLISPSNNSGAYYKRDVGSILLAAPVIEYSSDGSFE